MLFDGTDVTVLTGGHVDTANTHGTGCSLSAAIAAYLAHGSDVPTAVAGAKAFVHGALHGAARWRLGQGHGPLDHLGWTGEPPPGIAAPVPTPPPGRAARVATAGPAPGQWAGKTVAGPFGPATPPHLYRIVPPLTRHPSSWTSTTLARAQRIVRHRPSKVNIM